MISWAENVKKSLAGEGEIKKKKDAETLLMQNAHSNTSKTQVGQPSNNSITDSTEKVNSDTKLSYKTPAESKVYKRIAETVLSHLKPYLHGLNLSHIKAEIKHKYDEKTAVNRQPFFYILFTSNKTYQLLPLQRIS